MGLKCYLWWWRMENGKCRGANVGMEIYHLTASPHIVIIIAIIIVIIIVISIVIIIIIISDIIIVLLSSLLIR